MAFTWEQFNWEWPSCNSAWWVPKLNFEITATSPRGIEFMHWWLNDTLWWQIRVNIGASKDDLLPDSTKPSLEPMLTYQQRCSVAPTWDQLHEKYLSHQLLKLASNYLSEITFKSPRGQWINSLGPNDTKWWQRSGSTLAQVMAWCLTAPSHYLNQYWLIIRKVQWYSSEDNFTWYTSTMNHWNPFENYISKITFNGSPRGHWIKG